jgi:hypothetical protein
MNPFVLRQAQHERIMSHYKLIAIYGRIAMNNLRP